MRPWLIQTLLTHHTHKGSRILLICYYLLRGLTISLIKTGLLNSQYNKNMTYILSKVVTNISCLCHRGGEKGRELIVYSPPISFISTFKGMDKLQQWRTKDKLTINFSLKYINNVLLPKIKGITMICVQICSADFKLWHHQALLAERFQKVMWIIKTSTENCNNFFQYRKG